MAIAALRAALESERSSLHEIDASIKRIVQAPGPRHNHHDRFNSAGDVGRGGAQVGSTRRAEYPEELGKRRHETKTVFSRLSARQGGDSDHEEEAGYGKKPRISSQVTRDMPSKQEIMKAQCGDEQSKVRNRRMFGSLLGTLQKFKQEEIVLKSKEDKRAQVEKRIEQQALQEKEKQKRERQMLFSERELKKATIKALEAKLARVAEFDAWAAGQRALSNYILTRAAPRLYWLPRVLDTRAQEKLSASQQQHEEYMEKKRQQLEEELVKIEQKCLRSSKTQQIETQSAKENKTDEHKEDRSHTDKSSPRKREKFVSEVSVKHENGKSEGDRDRRNSKRERTVSDENDTAIETRPSEESVRTSAVKEEPNETKAATSQLRKRSESEQQMEVEHNGSPAANPQQCESEVDKGDKNESPADEDAPVGAPESATRCSESPTRRDGNTGSADDTGDSSD